MSKIVHSIKQIYIYIITVTVKSDNFFVIFISFDVLNQCVNRLNQKAGECVGMCPAQYLLVST